MCSNACPSSPWEWTAEHIIFVTGVMRASVLNRGTKRAAGEEVREETGPIPKGPVGLSWYCRFPVAATTISKAVESKSRVGCRSEHEIKSSSNLQQQRAGFFSFCVKAF